MIYEPWDEDALPVVRFIQILAEIETLNSQKDQKSTNNQTDKMGSFDILLFEISLMACATNYI